MVIHKSKNVMHHTNRIKDKIHMIILLNEENILIKFNIPSQSLKYDSKFLYSCEHLKANKLCSSKLQWWYRHGTNISIPEKRNQKEESSHRYWASPNTYKWIPSDLKVKNDPLWLSPLLSRSTGPIPSPCDPRSWSVLPHTKLYVKVQSVPEALCSDPVPGMGQGQADQLKPRKMPKTLKPRMKQTWPLWNHIFRQNQILCFYQQVRSA